MLYLLILATTREVVPFRINSLVLVPYREASHHLQIRSTTGRS
jgi:hypothetical protein